MDTPSIDETRCYCNVTGKWFAPRRVMYEQGACIYCDANRIAVDEPGYDATQPQWHPLLRALALAVMRAQQEAPHA